MEAAEVVIQLNAVIESGAFLAKTDWIPLAVQCTERFLVADVIGVALDSVPDQGAFALGMGAADGNAHDKRGPLTRL